MSRKRKPMRFKIIIFVLICSIIFGGVKLIQLTKDFLGYGELDFQKISTIEYDKDKNLIVHPFKEDIIIYNENNLKSFSIQGDEKWHLEKITKSPIIRTSENLFFLGDKETGKITAFDEVGGILWEVDLKKPMADLVCNKDGVIALYCENDENSEIYIFSREGKETGKVLIKNETVIDIAISDGEEMLGISVMDIRNNKIETKVALYSREGRLLGGNTYNDQIVSNLFFSDQDRLMCVGNRKLMVFSKEEASIWRKDVRSNIHRVAWNDSGFIAMHLINNERTIIDTKNRNHIGIIDMHGKEVSKTPIKGDVLGMDSLGENVIAFTERTLYIIFQEGKQFIEKKINNDIQSAYIFSNDKVILVLKNKIEIIQVKNKSKE